MWLDIFSTKLKYFPKNPYGISTGKRKYYVIRIEFQERGTLHVRLFIWIFNAPDIENEATYIDVNKTKENNKCTVGGPFEFQSFLS